MSKDWYRTAFKR